MQQTESTLILKFERIERKTEKLSQVEIILHEQILFTEACKYFLQIQKFKNFPKKGMFLTRNWEME